MYGKDDDPVMLSGYQFLAGGLLMVLFGICIGGKISAVSVSGILLLLYMAFISAGAYTLWGILLKHHPVSKIAVFGFCTPIFGVILSALILRESAGVQAKTLAALLLVCIGIVLVNHKKS